MMRLAESEISHIQSISYQVFGHDVSVWLFGSRVDDTKRGGDIDLLILASDVIQKHNLSRLDIDYCVRLKSVLGEQKIDTVYATHEDLVCDPFLRTLGDRVPLTGRHLLPLSPTLLGPFDVFHGSLGTGCYCAVWTLPASCDWASRCQRAGGQVNLDHTKQLVVRGDSPGYVLLDEAHMIGWIGAGPKAKFPLLAEKLGSRLTDAPAGRWSIVCLAILPQLRGKHLQDVLISLICDKAADEGATDIEAYPVDPTDPERSYRGSQQLYARHGFHKVAAESADGWSFPVMGRDVQRPSKDDQTRAV